MRLKIFSCHHVRPEFTCNTEIFQTLVSNIPEPEDGSFMSDLGGVNIAGDNVYSEMRHQFYVWKNLIESYDYVGFEHYRRPFFIDPLPVDRLEDEFPAVLHLRLYFALSRHVGLRRNPDIFNQYLAMRRSLDAATIARLKTWIGGYDIIVPRPNIGNLEQQWKSCFKDDALWNTMVEGLINSRFFRARRNYIYLQMEVCYFANMYIIRSDLLEEYLDFCFEVLAFCQAKLALGGRGLGYFSERLFSFWLYQKRIEIPNLRMLELPFVMYNPPANGGIPRQL
jgi:hypothetical protein